MAKETAEQRLLRLVEESGSKDKPAAASASGAASAAPSAEAAKLLSSVSTVGVGAINLPPFLQNLLSIFHRGSKPKESFGLKHINQILMVIAIAMIAFFLQDFSKGMKESRRQVRFDVKQMAVQDSEIFVPQSKDVNEYVAIVSERNIFKPFEKKVEEPQVAAPIENQMIKDKVVNFKVVGISWLNSPETATVMIENTKTSVTHFLKTGDALEGVKVDTIYADRVEMSFDGQKVTINL